MAISYGAKGAGWSPFPGGPVYYGPPANSGVTVSGNSSPANSGVTVSGNSSSANSGVTVSSNSPAASVAGSVSSAVSRALDLSRENNAWSAAEAEDLRDWQVEQNQKAMDFNAAEAAKNRDWQQYMSNTAHQREIADLKAAGLNPVLSAMGGHGAAVTSGATASGVTSSGAKGEVDTSANAAIAGLLSSFLNAQTQLQVMNTNAITNLAVADKYNAMSKYVAELQSQITLTNAGISAAVSRYVSDNNLKGSLAQAAATKISATLHNEATKYAADKGYLSSENVANINADINMQLKKLGIDAEFDLREQYPNNFWQAAGPQLKETRSILESILGFDPPWSFRSTRGSGFAK